MAGEISFTPTEQDYVSANRDWTRLHLASGKAWRSRALLAAFVWLCGFATRAFDGSIAEAVLTAFGWLALAAVAVAVATGLCVLIAPRRAARLYRQQKTLQQQFRYTWSDEGLSLETARSAGRYAWSELHNCADGRTAVLLFFNEQLFYFLPKRVLGADAAADLLETADRAGVPRL